MENNQNKNKETAMSITLKVGLIIAFYAILFFYPELFLIPILIIVMLPWILQILK